MERFTHGKKLWWILSKKNIIKLDSLPELIPSAAIKDYTTVKQLRYFINKMQENHAVVLMFHSILPKKLVDQGNSHWRWSSENFEELCKFLKATPNIKIITTGELVAGGYNAGKFNNQAS